MKSKILIILLLFTAAWAEGQEIRRDTVMIGEVSYISTQNVYVKFESTAGILKGDTLFLSAQGQIPCLIVEQKSSISIVGKKISDQPLNKGDKLYILTEISKEIQKELSPDNTKISREIKITDSLPSTDTLSDEKKTREQKLYGRINLSSYSGLSNTNAEDSYRLRYTASLNAEHIANSRYSFDSYLAFSHKPGHWEEVKADIFEGLKVYSLAIGSQIGDNTDLWLGRRINNKVSSIGAIDGLQAETRIKDFSFGGMAGSRPDYSNYGFNLSLFEYGAFAAHQYTRPRGNMQNSVGFFQQMNGGMVDRRFAYIQHSNTLLTNLNLFFSTEIDLYRIQEGLINNSPSLTSLYVSARYKLSRKLSVYGMYDARKNIIYFETFKDYAEKLLEEATRQGLQLKINYRPFNNVNLGLSGGYRTRDGDVRPNQNLRGIISLSRLPWINASATITGNWLSTSYLDGLVLNLRVSKDLIPGKLSSSYVYRFVDYTFIGSGSKMLQHSFQTYLSYQLSKLSSVSVNYELNLESGNQYHRIYFNFVQRFKN